MTEDEKDLKDLFPKDLSPNDLSPAGPRDRATDPAEDPLGLPEGSPQERADGRSEEGPGKRPGRRRGVPGESAIGEPNDWELSPVAAAAAAEKGGTLTPALRQFFEAKAQCPDSILFFQMGDFYELFFEDAELVAPILDLALTSRQKLNGKPVPLCGVPLSTGDNYVNRLVALGHKVAVCDQIGKIGPGGGLAKRQITRVVTPATLFSQEGQPRARHLAALYRSGNEYALAAIDLATGDFVAGRFFDPASFRTAVSLLDPPELVIGRDPENLSLSEPYPGHSSPGAAISGTAGSGTAGADTGQGGLVALAESLGVLVNRLPPESFDPDLGRRELVGALGPEVGEKVFTGWPSLLSAAGGALTYLKGLNAGKGLRHLSEPRLLWERGFMTLDETASRNLELFKPARDGDAKATLIAQIDRTKTAMGARLLRDWLARPLIDKTAIEARLAAVESLLGDLGLRNALSEKLGRGGDLERSMSRLALGRGMVRDLLTVRTALAAAPSLKDLLSQSPSDLLANLGQNLDPLSDLLYRITTTLIDEIPPGANEFIIKPGLSPKLDELRELESGGRRALAELEATERRKTGINALKVGYNRVHGYYLEVTKLNLANVPKEWTRKQTLAGGERYVTEELKLWEEKILTAGEKRRELEARILDNLKEALAREVAGLKALAGTMAQTDALVSLAASAESLGWVKPAYTEDNLIDVIGGRHPVVERFLPPGETFVENDARLSPDERLLIVTGPNMAGKSTVLRQTALIVILGQMGSFVPARKAVLSVRDRVFTRVGASDDLARGQSTFMVEMSETARILKEATNRSLVILDEVGRGTSTYDGLAIAWAVAEHLH
ncbi:MAG: DNA mismatch repair protein MutS, partial [Deltaproteobacteria bacterium]|nr:DNA mismatch repair protein MutS [Deltaproteobacteria bacterium]